jgi:hypothetical protein
MAGARLVIINRGETPFEPHAHLRFYEGIGEILAGVVKRLKKLRGLYGWVGMLSMGGVESAIGLKHKSTYAEN